MEKRRVLIDYRKLPIPLRRKLKEEHPEGYKNEWRRVEVPNKNEWFMSLTLDTEDAIYLVRFKERKRLAHELENENEDDDLETLDEDAA
jgi:hypothetical protein